jgi:hypothetical protein
MGSLGRGLLAGALAGAAGTTALNAVTYLDMAVRGRPASSSPEDSMQRLADSAGVTIPGDDQTRANRLSGLGALTGLVVGTAVGATYGAVASAVGKPPATAGGLLVAAGAMLGANAPMVAMRVTDVRTWGVSGWLADAVPHLAYGVVTAATYDLAA